MSYQRRLSDQLIEGLQSACEAQNEILATVLREAANVELSGVHRSGHVDRRPNSSAFRRALAQHAYVFHA
jgi:hypothetical protein